MSSHRSDLIGLIYEVVVDKRRYPTIMKRLQAALDDRSWLPPALPGRDTSTNGENGPARLLALFRQGVSTARSESDRSLLQALLPHVERAVVLHGQLADRRTLTAKRALLDLWAVGVLIVDQQGEVLQMNASAEALFDQRHRVDPAGTRQDEGAGARSVRVDARTRQTRTLTPSPARTGWQPPIGTTRVVLMVDRGRSVGVDPALLGRFYRLTPAEARVAALLVAGKSATSICDRLNITRNTLKTQVKRVLTKTGTSSQSELAARVLENPLVLRPIPSGDQD